MKNLFISLSFIFIFCFTFNAQAEEKVIGHPSPFQNERLFNAITLNDCSKVQIIEWKGSKNNKLTRISLEGIELINSICKFSELFFVSFAETHGYYLSNTADPNWIPRNLEETISLLPWKTMIHQGNVYIWDESGEGSQYRNLQDYKYRFPNRFIPGEARFEVYGWTDHKISGIFVLNDVLNTEPEHPKFTQTLAHEFFHALSHSSEIYYQMGDFTNERQEKDEKLADEFGKFIEQYMGKL